MEKCCRSNSSEGSFHGAKKTKASRLNFTAIRIGVFALLGLLIAGIGASSFLILRSSEIKDFLHIYRSSVEQLSTSLETHLKNKVFANIILGNIYAAAINDGSAGVLPNVTLNGFNKIANPLNDMASSRIIGFFPMLSNKTRRSWESYAAANVDSLSGPPSLKTRKSPNDWVVSDGIFSRNADGKKVYSKGYKSNSKYPYLITPVWQIAPMESSYTSVMYDAHSDALRQPVIDKVIETLSSGFTDLVQLVIDGDKQRPSTLLYSPMLSFDDDSKIEGIMFNAFTWDDILQKILPSFLPSIVCVLSTPTKTVSFLLQSGKAQLIGDGDHHDSKYNSLKEEVTSTVFSAFSSPEYAIAFYPTRDFEKRYITELPAVVCSVFVGIIVLTSILVFFYDTFVMSREKALLNSILETSNNLASMRLSELESKKCFVRYISHEIRTPLNTMKMGLTLLRQDVLTECDEESLLSTLGDLELSCNTALEVVNDFLLFDKIASETLVLDNSIIDISTFLDETVQLFYVQARQANIDLTVTSDVGGSTGSIGDVAEEERRPSSVSSNRILADRHKLAQVVRNMLSNALKFTPKGGRVRVSLTRVEVNEPYDRMVFRLSVEDSGAGISLENQARLFKEIVQFDASRLQSGGGSGLGMYISHGIAVLHGGSLSVFSKGEGEGTTFTLDLPVYERSTKEVPLLPVESLRGAHSPRSPTADLHRVVVDMEAPLLPLSLPLPLSCRYLPPRSTSGFVQTYDSLEFGGAFASHDDYLKNQTKPTPTRVLVVDDATTNRKMLCRLLQMSPSGYICDEAVDGADAVEKVLGSLAFPQRSISVVTENYEQADTFDPNINESPYSVIIMDYEMPKMIGPDAVKAIRDMGFRGLIMGATGYSDDVDKQTFLQSGADCVLTKPLHMPDVLKIIENYIQ